MSSCGLSSIPRTPACSARSRSRGGPAINSVAFSRDGRTLAIGDDNGDGNGDVQLWDIADPAHPRPLGQAVTLAAPIESVAFSPTGTSWPAAASTVPSGCGTPPIP